MANLEDIDNYLRVLAIQQLPGVGFPEGYARREEFGQVLSELIELVATANAAPVSPYRPALVDSILDDLEENRVLVSEEDPIAGLYFTLDKQKLVTYRRDYLPNNPIYARAQRIGPRFFPDVFNAYSSRLNGEPDPEISATIGVPASDRIVSLTHNQSAELIDPLDELIEQVESNNGVPDEPGFRELMVGQLRAGRELVRVGSFKAYVIYVTLFQALTSLAARYKDHVIGATAGKLVELLVEHVFKAN